MATILLATYTIRYIFYGLWPGTFHSKVAFLMRFSSVKPEIVSVLLSSAFRAERSSTLFRLLFSALFQIHTHKYVHLECTNLILLWEYRISSYSFRPWIVSSHLCTVTFGLMYCDLWISKFKKEWFPRKLHEEIRYLWLPLNQRWIDNAMTVPSTTPS